MIGLFWRQGSQYWIPEITQADHLSNLHAWHHVHDAAYVNGSAYTVKAKEMGRLRTKHAEGGSSLAGRGSRCHSGDGGCRSNLSSSGKDNR